VNKSIRRHRHRPCDNNGFSYIELMLAVTIASLIMLGLGGVISQALQSQDVVHEKNRLTREARFAMQQMTHNIRYSRLLILPLNDNPATNWPEQIREQTVPASAPIGNSLLATAVLALTLPANVDQDDNGFADADNDNDGLIDEDPGADNNNDGASGCRGIDDDGDGQVDEGVVDGDGQYSDNDEDGANQEETLDGLDNDKDGSIDEDIKSDTSNDGKSGIAAIDDNGNGLIDESLKNDDDEDGKNNEDWFDPVVFYLAGSTLRQRTPVPWDEDGNGTIDGRDFIESDIAENISRFRVERLPLASNRAQLIDITLELTSPVSAEKVSLQAQVRLGAGL